jgi:hypothetical protein
MRAFLFSAAAAAAFRECVFIAQNYLLGAVYAARTRAS